MNGFVTVSGKNIHYIEEGSGSKVVLMFHGASFKAETWKEVGSLRVASEAGYRAIAVDFPGYGQSEGKRENLSDFVGDFIASLSVREPVLLGASMGGKAVLEFALSNRKVPLKSLILVGPVGLKENQARLNQLKGVRILAIWGSEDTISPPQDNSYLLQEIGAKTAIIDGAPHACYMKEPQKFNQILYEYLTSI